MKKIFKIGFLVIAIASSVLLIISATINNSNLRCKTVIVKIANNSSQYLVTADDVKKWATLYGSEPLEGKVLSAIDFSVLEKRLKASAFLNKSEAYSDVKGNVILDVEAYQPIARILIADSLQSKYIDKNGTIIPVSKHFSPTLLLIGGDYFKNTNNFKAENNTDIVAFLNKINTDKFWQAQITQIEIDANKEIKMWPHMGNQIIYFGKPEKINGKFDKLMTFYKTIMPMEKWRDFKSISLKYDSQIVCN